MAKSLTGVFLLLLALNVFFTNHQASAQDDTCTLQIDVTDVIGPATVDSVRRAIELATQMKCQSIMALINTPGGSLPSTRLVVEDILNSPVPFLCLISPSGGHAGSAGAIIMQACHVNGALPATNIGAATPVSGDGQQMPEDLRKKMLNDSRSWLEGLTRLRGRNEKFGQDIIMEAKAVSAKEAKDLGAIDWAGNTKDEFLQFSSQRKVKMKDQKEELVVVGRLHIVTPDFRHKLVSILTDPQIAYLMFMGSLALLYFEITHPGFGVAGVLGGMGLIVSLISMHKLEVEWGGLLLLLLGVALLIAEIFVTSFGILGIGGIVAFVVGSIFLYDPAKTGGYTLPFEVILPAVVIVAGIMLTLGYMFMKSRKVKKHGSYDEMLDQVGVVVDVAKDLQSGMMEIMGETWKFEASAVVKVMDKVKVVGYQGLVLKVKPVAVGGIA